ncbi:peptidyl-prolyl cis-trans isomerase FKBP4 isoform X2 [Bombus vosnesenskii]|nr:peptidyl-prolyl cis-trans isomerase FKBP4 isoform X2 [Bombus vancouverensis nearcticus]XP_033299780.1 peptidyl-prolyl cis-trans isomerase FKBP4 isoform X2 [Bombus bifarius]XP_033360753.1 peptidyl-prolyl cis-trans isomerase FKBP4 isoform X2 [Bombus vosnesenskii]XP_050496214.1 peptidyl-prolyl cis-trans isomerase FKBP4 isoform X2 [Bombus huntii]
MAIDISPNKDGGVQKEIIKEGIGDETPSPGSNVIVHYTGTLMDGTKFDSSKDRNEPFQFELKKGSVIKAWDIGVATMKKGEVALLTCAPEYAYGKNGSPPKIPSNATLKFEIEMIDWKGEDLSPEKNGSIERYQIVQGKDYITPQEGALVNVHLTGIYNGKVFEDRDVQFSLGEGEDCGVIEGVEKALESFKSGEKSKLKIKSKYAYKNVGKPEFDIPPNATVEYTVELKSFEKAVEPWSLNSHQQIEQAKVYKEKGTNYFKMNKYNLAIKMYKKVTSFLKYEDGFEADLKTERNNLILSAHLNLALSYLKIEQNVEAKDACNEALKLSPQNEKALFRRGQAYLALASPEIAIKDFQEVLKIEPKNTAAIKQIGVCNSLIKRQLAKEKKLYANMFDKFAQEDKQ